MTSIKPAIGFCIKAIVSFGLLYWLLTDLNFQEILESVKQADYLLLLAAFLLHPIGLLISAYRWQILLAARGAVIRLPVLFASYFVGMFFNNFLPSTIGGDVYRAYDSWRLGQSKSDAAAVVFVDRLLGVVALAIFAFIALYFERRFSQLIPNLSLWIALCLIGLASIVIFIFYTPQSLVDIINRVIQLIKGKTGQKIAALVDAFLAFRGERATLFSALILSFLLQINVVVHYYLIGLSMDFDISLLSYFLIIPVVTIVLMLPISINGIGVREGIFALFLAGYGIAKAESVAFVWIGFAMVLVQSVLGGVLYILRK